LVVTKLDVSPCPSVVNFDIHHGLVPAVSVEKIMVVEKIVEYLSLRWHAGGDIQRI
jgi:hypothetical protein